MTSFLIFADPPTAQARSHQRAQAMGCAGDTAYWWSQIVNASTNQAALALEDAARADGQDFTANGLTDAERAQIVTQADMASSWFPEAT